eukprot:COSAG04_NODE_3113_length_3154_cov_2.142062_1_plen_42_part_00
MGCCKGELMVFADAVFFCLFDFFRGSVHACRGLREIIVQYP